MNAPLLDIAGLEVVFRTPRGPVAAVRDVTLAIARGERVGIVGESGSGKSVTGRAVLGLLPAQARVRAERLHFAGQDLRTLDAAGWRALRGRRVAMVMQDPKYSLNPVMRVGAQLVEALRCREPGLSAHAARDRALERLVEVRIREPARVFASYPHELSGGMGQRVMIAMMVAGGPELLIADEPTSALDVTVRLQILALLDAAVGARGMGLAFISHDLNLVADFCDRVVVMYAGRVLETLPAAELRAARHPYTRGLLDALPRLDRPRATLPVLARDPAWLDGDGR
ncbi:MAG: ABC transporter ATP-binding protein [Proteobacteria bacterium]|nr:ABC transporter ATP-binding protein [Pseudomonadota bacterium]